MKTPNPLLLALFALFAAHPRMQAAPQSITPEDPQLRARAVGLIEQATQLTRPVWPMNEEFATFHISNPEPGAATDGSLRIGVAKPWLMRWEYEYGTYHFIKIENGDEYASLITGTRPASLEMVLRLLPANLVRFDQTDVIQSITDEPIDGTPASCIYVESIAGTRHQSSKICTDKAVGFLIYEQIDQVVIKQSAFFRFNNAYLPGHIERWVNGVKIVEIESKVEVRPNGFPADYFNYPAGATITQACDSFVRAYAENTPQPPAKSNSDTAIDVVVHGVIDKTGHTTDLKAADQTYPYLAEEAVKLVATWTFRPAQCDYKPATEHRDFVVHFQGWQ